MEKLEREEVRGRHCVCRNGGGNVIVWIFVSSLLFNFKVLTGW